MQHRNTGILLILGTVAALIPFTILGSTFNYPDILREEPATVLRKFHEGGSSLVITWLAMALSGLILIPAYYLAGKAVQKQKWGSLSVKIGIIAIVAQMIGLLRWTFVVPALANDFVNTIDPVIHASIIQNFKLIHQFAGVLLGEHIGQLFTIAWTIMMAVMLQKESIIPTWNKWFGIASACIYLIAQAELLHTVIPGFPQWEPAGVIGSSLWLIWMIITGICLIRNKKSITIGSINH